MIGGFTGAPTANATGPGTPTPIPRTSAADRPTEASSSVKRASTLARTASGPEAIEDLWLYLHLMLEAIGAYRFLYRNLDDLLGRNRRLREHFARIVERKQEVVVALCEGLVRGRAMRARPEEIRGLARNALLVATFWPSFRALAGRRGAAGDPAELGQGAYQVMSLFAPYLVGSARGHLDALSRGYID